MANPRENLEAYREAIREDATTLGEVLTGMMDAFVARRPWLATAWVIIKKVFSGKLVFPEDEVERASTLDALLEMFLKAVDAAVEASGRPLLKMLWRVVRTYLSPSAIAAEFEFDAMVRPEAMELRRRPPELLVPPGPPNPPRGENLTEVG